MIARGKKERPSARVLARDLPRCLYTDEVSCTRPIEHARTVFPSAGRFGSAIQNRFPDEMKRRLRVYEEGFYAARSGRIGLQILKHEYNLLRRVGEHPLKDVITAKTELQDFVLRYLAPVT